MKNHAIKFFDNCTHCYNVEILNIFDSELQLINTKPIIKNKLKELLSKLKKFESSNSISVRL